MKEMAIFGAGNIGRAFIAPIFSQLGYRCVFIDVAESIITGLSSRRSYPVHFIHPDGKMVSSHVAPVHAIHASDNLGVQELLARVDLCATAVGQNALPHVARHISRALKNRAETFNLILAENTHHASRFFRSFLESENSLKGILGLIEASIGKMVPMPSAETLRQDPLLVVGEAYHTLILDRAAFLGSPPKSPHIEWVTPIQPYGDRKLYLHNLGHAAAAYFGFQLHPSVMKLSDVLNDERVFEHVGGVMAEGAQILSREYPNSWTHQELTHFAKDLLERFKNPFLGDTVYRIGRDIARKLGPFDRFLGAMRLAKKHQCGYPHIIQAYHAARLFRARDELGQTFSPDDQFFENQNEIPFPDAAIQLSGLKLDNAMDHSIYCDLASALTHDVSKNKPIEATP